MAGPTNPDHRRLAGHSAIRIVLIALGLLTPPSVAGPGEGAAANSDWELTLRARHTLWEEPSLEKLNLGVRVRQGVATLNGPVPCLEVAEQAATLLKRVAGIRGVINETYVPPADDPLTQAMPHPVTSRRPPETVAPPLTPAPAEVSGLPAPAPVPPASPNVASNAPAATLLPPVASPTGPLTIGEQIEQMRQRDNRFRDVRAMVQDGRVTLTGRVARSQDAWEFAAVVRQLPGVKGVVQSIGAGSW
jgi:osmotically-inducible protein OsmY